MTRISHRGRGLAKALLQAAERSAIGARGRQSARLDTAVDNAASGLYERVASSCPGVLFRLPNQPHGCGTDGTRCSSWNGCSLTPCCDLRGIGLLRLAPPTTRPWTLSTAISSAHSRA